MHRLSTFLKTLSTFKRIILVVLFASPILVLGCLLLGFGFIFPWFQPIYKPRLPDEELLRTVFAAKRVVFEEIRTMASEEGSGGLAPFQISNHDATSFGLPPERLREYRKRLASIHPGLVFLMNGDQIAKFDFEGGTTRLVVGPEWSNGIEYLAADVKRYGEIVSSRKQMQLKDGDTSLIPLGDHWYIFHEEL